MVDELVGISKFFMGVLIVISGWRLVTRFVLGLWH